MKKSFCLLALIVMILTGCKRESIDITGLIAERDSIKEACARHEQELNSLNEFMGTISDGLDSISQQEGLITLMGKEKKTMTQEEMKQSLSNLSKLLARQRSRIASLKDSLKSKGTGNADMEKIIAYLNEQLETKEKTINDLRAQLNSRNADIAQLQKKVTNLNETVEHLDKKTKIQQEALVTQSDMINEGYVKIGTTKELKKAGILLGTLRKKLNPESLSHDGFSKVDIRQYQGITTKSKKLQILPSRAPSSYTITKNGDGTSTLTITNPTLFWDSSNYLVIKTD